jgi:type I restriction enzyme R subunit
LRSAAFESKEQAFLDFVLSHYVRVGVQELDQEKLTPLLRLKYNNSIADAVAHLGKPEDIGRVSSASRNICISKKRVRPEHR